MKLRAKRAVWAMTCIGAAAQLWVFHLDRAYLIPYDPSTQGKGKGKGKSQGSVDRSYLEISEPEQGAELLAGLEFVRNHPVPPDDLLQVPPLPRPSNVRLPRGWYDSDVAMLDEWRRQGDRPRGDPGGTGMPHANAPFGFLSAGVEQDATSSADFERAARPEAEEEESLAESRMKSQKFFYVPEGGWVTCDVSFRGGGAPSISCSYTGVSGVSYYSWALECAGDNK